MIAFRNVSISLISEKHMITLDPWFPGEDQIEWCFYLFTTKTPNTDLDIGHKYETELDEGNPYTDPIEMIRDEASRELLELGAPEELVTAALNVAEAIEKAALTITTTA